MELTIKQESIEMPALGYMINTLLSEKSSAEVSALQKSISLEYPGMVWTPPKETLHITLMDWPAPLVEYSKDKDGLFEEIFPQYNAILEEILKDLEPININFSEFIVSSSAIAIKGDNQCAKIFNKIREQFLSRVDLLPDTKRPPKIVHTTIARFIGSVAIEDVSNFLAKTPPSIDERVTEFQLVRETKVPMIEYSTLRRYSLI